MLAPEHPRPPIRGVRAPQGGVGTEAVRLATRCPGESSQRLPHPADPILTSKTRGDTGESFLLVTETRQMPVHTRPPGTTRQATLSREISRKLPQTLAPPAPLTLELVLLRRVWSAVTGVALANPNEETIYRRGGGWRRGRA